MTAKQKQQNGAAPDPAVETYSGQTLAVEMNLPSPKSAKREALRARALVVGRARAAAFQRATQGKGKPMKYPDAKA